MPLPLSTVSLLVIRPAPAHPFLPVPVDKPEGRGVFRKGNLAADDYGDALSSNRCSILTTPGGDTLEMIFPRTYLIWCPCLLCATQIPQQPLGWPSEISPGRIL